MANINYDIMPGTEEQFEFYMTSAYIGFDPTADSLHIGNLVQIMTLVHLQNIAPPTFYFSRWCNRNGRRPFRKKQSERNLLDLETINHNLKCIKNQLQKFLHFDNSKNSADELLIIIIGLRNSICILFHQRCW